MLAPEFKSGATPRPQLRPEFALNLRSLDTKWPPALARVVVARNHRVARPRTGALNNDPLWVPQTAPISRFRRLSIFKRKIFHAIDPDFLSLSGERIKGERPWRAALFFSAPRIKI
jgi:hypothetical protein